jgi:hypothetical protein
MLSRNLVKLNDKQDALSNKFHKMLNKTSC